MAEFVGLYGPYQVSELVLQRIWLEGAFDVSRLADERGQPIEVESPGQWNRLEGPDFKGAVLRIGGERVEGDVEVHFARSHWRQHGHDADANYDGVILHVVYHPHDAAQAPVATSAGRPIPTAALMPLLWYSLEEYASDDSIVGSTGVEIQPELERLQAVGVEARRRELFERSRERWELKLHFARQRIERLGWTGACHQSALEILGYARNRAPMLLVGRSCSIEAFALGAVTLEEAWAAGRGKWRPRGCRPANHPRTRLLQYMDWAQERPEWPLELQRLATELGFSPQSDRCDRPGCAEERKRLGIARLSRAFGNRLLADAVTGTRAATLAVDGFLPLLAAESGADLFWVWFHWPLGDGPDACAGALRKLQVLEPRAMPACNGWLQGALALRNRANA